MRDALKGVLVFKTDFIDLLLPLWSILCIDSITTTLEIRLENINIELDISRTLLCLSDQTEASIQETRAGCTSKTSHLRIPCIDDENSPLRVGLL